MRTLTIQEFISEYQPTSRGTIMFEDFDTFHSQIESAFFEHYYNKYQDLIPLSLADDSDKEYEWINRRFRHEENAEKFAKNFESMMSYFLHSTEVKDEPASHILDGYIHSFFGSSEVMEAGLGYVLTRKPTSEELMIVSNGSKIKLSLKT